MQHIPLGVNSKDFEGTDHSYAIVAQISLMVVFVVCTEKYKIKLVLMDQVLFTVKCYW